MRAVMDSMMADGAKDIYIGKHGGVDQEDGEVDEQLLLRQQEEEVKEGMILGGGEAAGQTQQREQRIKLGKQAEAGPRRVAGSDVGLDCLEYVPMPLSQVRYGGESMLLLQQWHTLGDNICGDSYMFGATQFDSISGSLLLGDLWPSDDMPVLQSWDVYRPHRAESTVS